jgi:uncharacterized protein YbbC (DUF1343 family)
MINAIKNFLYQKICSASILFFFVPILFLEASAKVTVGAERLLDSLSLLANKKIALVINHTSLLPNGEHLIDALYKRNVKIQCIFAPEHGYRGTAEAGKEIPDERDVQRGVPVFSLYGKQKKPTHSQLKNVDIVIFDIQDVGVRCYTYLTTLIYVMQACAESKIALWVLDRPNPNCGFIGGPLLESGFESFVGAHPVPLVYGLTLGEYALMAQKEKWISIPLELKIFQMFGYKRSMQWQETGLPWPIPSPNLRSPQAAAFYPILCWYEGTIVSVGRGTYFPFEALGFPYHYPIKNLIDKKLNDTSLTIRGGLRAKPIYFIPQALKNIAENPPFKNRRCYGYKLESIPQADSLFLAGIILLKEFYELYKSERGKNGKLPSFFNSFFRLLAGNEEFQKMIEGGASAEQILSSWQPNLESYKKMKEKYHLYPF